MNKKISLLLCNVIMLCVASENDSKKRLPLCVGSYSTENGKRQEDRFLCSSIKVNERIKREGPDFFVVCDGHSGDQVAEELSKNLSLYFSEFLPLSRTKKEAFEKALSKAEKTISHDAGSTVVAGYFGKNHLHVAWVGDSRLAGKTCATQDHTLARKDEWDRVCGAKGVIFRMINQQKTSPWRINGLMPTRTIKDPREKGQTWRDLPLRFTFGNIEVASDSKEHSFSLEKQTDCFLVKDFYSLEMLPLPGQIIADPEYIKVDLNEENDLFIFATDGLWDVFSNKDAISLVEKFMQEKKSMDDAAKALVRAACERGSRDNITAVLVRLFSKVAK